MTKTPNTPPRVRTRFNTSYTPPAYKPGESKTQQHQFEQSDINALVARFTRAGMSPAGNQPGNFLDLVSAPLDNLLDAELLLKQAHDSFMGLPSATRMAFGNNAPAMVAWLQDPQNHPQAVQMGLLPASVLPKAPEAPKAPETPKTPPSEEGAA